MYLFFLLFISIGPSSYVSGSLINNASVASKLLLISFDGFRHDYLDKALSFGINISGFQKIWASGFRAMRVDNEFTTRTAPNHFSMVTGQHEETHGIVDNAFFDPNFNQSFVLGDATQSTEAAWFDTGAEPIWVTNQKHGHRTGVTSWPGSSAPIKGILPSVRYPTFDKSIPLRKSIDDVIGWLESDINLALLYHAEPDTTGHETGPGSADVMRVIEALNHDLEYLLKRVRQSSKLNSALNIILTSDHGMADIDTGRVIVLDDFLNDTMYTSPGSNSRVIWGLWPKGDFTPDDLIGRLKHKHPKMNVYLKEEMPRRLFYSRNRRIAPVVVFADVGWMIVKSKQDGLLPKRRGEHGYDPASPEMSPFFLATGPGFKPLPPNHTIPSIRLIDIYPMMCHLLGLTKPGPHNGSLSHVSHLLRTVNHQTESWFHSSLDAITVIFIFSVIGALSAILVGFVCLLHCRLRRRSIQLLRRARQQKSAQQQDVQLRRLSAPRSLSGNNELNNSNGSPSRLPEDVQRLLLAANDEEEVEHFNKAPRFYVDDSTLLSMLHDPHSRLP